MTTPSLGTTVMLLPLSEGDLFQIVEQQLKSALATAVEDTACLAHVCATLFSHMVTDVFDTQLATEHWDRALGTFLERQLAMFAKRRYELFESHLVDLLERHGPQCDLLEIDIGAELWQASIDADEFIARQVASYQSGRHSLPPPGLD